MKPKGKMRARRAVLLVCGLAAIATAAGCGDEDFPNDRRPPALVTLTGTILDQRITLSPTHEGAGPIQLKIANLTDRAHTVTLEGEDVIERTAPIQPQDTATIKKTLPSGTYEVRAGSSRAVDIEDQIRPATLTIGPERADANNDLLLP